jgi:hypothetical protein
VFLGGPERGWLYDYQGLVAGILALSAAAITVWWMRRQLGLMEAQLDLLRAPLLERERSILLEELKLVRELGTWLVALERQHWRGQDAFLASKSIDLRKDVVRYLTEFAYSFSLSGGPDVQTSRGDVKSAVMAIGDALSELAWGDENPVTQSERWRRLGAAVQECIRSQKALRDALAAEVDPPKQSLGASPNAHT